MEAGGETKDGPFCKSLVLERGNRGEKVLCGGAAQGKEREE